MTEIRLRSDVSSAWADSANNPILAKGEVGVNLTNNRFKIGNGKDTWTNLSYAGAGKGNLFLNGHIGVTNNANILTTLGAKVGFAADRWRMEIDGTHPTSWTTNSQFYGYYQTTDSSTYSNSIEELSSAYPMRNFLQFYGEWYGDSLTKRNIGQRILDGGWKLKGIHTFSYWARDRSTTNSSVWLTPYSIKDAVTVTGTPVLLGTTWKRYTQVFDLGTTHASGGNLEIGLQMPLSPAPTWALAGTSTDKIVTATGTGLVIKTADTSKLVTNAYVRIQGATEGTAYLVLEGTITAVTANTSITVDVTKVSGTSTSDTITTDSWKIYTSIYIAGSVTPVSNSALVLTPNIVPDAIAPGDFLWLRNRATPANWMYGEVVSKTTTTITVDTTDLTSPTPPYYVTQTRHGGVASSGWDISRELDGNLIDIWGLQFESDRGASEFQIASGSEDAEELACLRYYERLSSVQFVVGARSTANALGPISFIPKAIIPTVSIELPGQFYLNNVNLASSVTSAVVASTSNSSARISLAYTAQSGTAGFAGYGYLAATIKAEI